MRFIMFPVFREIASNDAKNTVKAASARENMKIKSGKTAPISDFNSLLVTNLGTVNIEVQLDEQAAYGRIFPLPAGAVLSIQPHEGIVFNQVAYKNIDAAAATVADTITFRWAKAVRVD